MRDHDDRPPPGHLLKGQLHLRLAFRVGKGAGLVQDHHVGILQHGAGDGDALLLAAGEIRSPAAQYRVEALRQALDDIHALGFSERFQHFALGGVRLRDAQIVRDGALEQAAVLEDVGHMLHQRLLGNPARVHAANEHLALLRIVESGDQAGHRGLPAAGRADDGDDLIPLRLQGQVENRRRSIGGVAIGHVPQLHGRAVRLLALLRLRQRLNVEDRVHPGDRVLDLHVILAHEHHLGHGRGDGRSEDDVKQEVQQNIHPVVVSADQEQRQSEDKHKGAVDQHGVPDHGRAHHPGIVHAEFAVVVDGRLEAVKGKHGLPEGLDHRDAPHILHGLVAHALQRVLVLPHILLHGRARHAHHDREAQRDGDQAGDAIAPITTMQTGMAIAPAMSGRLCASSVSVEPVTSVTIRRTLPEPISSAKPMGRRAMWRISAFFILAAVRNALPWEQTNALTYTSHASTANSTAIHPLRTMPVA